MKYKLICFDLDGTLVDDTKSIWQTIHEAVGTDNEERRQVMKNFFAGKITYDEWAQHDLALWREKKVSKKQILEIFSKLKMMPGAIETVNELKNRGYILAVVSGSIDLVITTLFPDNPFDYIFINKMIFKDGMLDNIKSTQYDTEHKASALKLICEKEGITLNETVFVGDHDNDVEIAKQAELSIAFNCISDELLKVSDIVIKEKNIKEILKYI